MRSGFPMFPLGLYTNDLKKLKFEGILNKSYINIIYNTSAKTLCIIISKTDNEATFNLIVAPDE